MPARGFAQRLHDRDAAGDRRLEAERRAIGLRKRGQRDAVMGEQRLVGCDDGLAGRQRGLHRRFRRPLRAADQLDDTIDLAGLRQCHRIVEELETADIDATVAVAVTRGHRGQRDATAGPAANDDDGSAGSQQRGADRAETGDPDAKRLNHVTVHGLTAASPPLELMRQGEVRSRVQVASSIQPRPSSE